MTLLGHDTSYPTRILRGLRTMLFPRPRPRIRPRRAHVVAHRGTTAGAPENTLEGCQLAIDRGADGVEVDLCITRDGHIVLWHDHNPDTLVAIARQSGAEGRTYVPKVPDFRAELRKPVAQLTLAEVLSTHGYDLVSEAPKNVVGPGDGRSVAPALLPDFLKWVAAEDRARVIVLDVKVGATELEHVRPFVGAIAAGLASEPSVLERELFVLTPYAEVYDALATEMPAHESLAGVPLVPDFELPGVVDVATQLGARHVSIGNNPRRTWSSTRDDVVEAVRAREDGELDWVLVWTANDEKVLRELGRLAVDAVLTDHVAYARSILDVEHERHRALLRRREQARIKIPGDKVR